MTLFNELNTCENTLANTRVVSNIAGTTYILIFVYQIEMNNFKCELVYKVITVLP
jgi:hypothetical protein